NRDNSPGDLALHFQHLGQHPPDRQPRIMPGETVGIVGESGSGKSTLARAVLGLTPLSSGNVTFDGVDLALQKSAGLAKLRRETA
ncbi:ATP-binding cassette domain-containing protein, partial [Rhizobium leguminosarum]|uniref:ATP-binding cassette domain-containing protein n=1 Tax=Rhizobium leguminosarum TaxID=384 RepID=UPI003F9D0B8E